MLRQHLCCLHIDWGQLSLDEVLHTGLTAEAAVDSVLCVLCLGQTATSSYLDETFSPGFHTDNSFASYFDQNKILKRVFLFNLKPACT